MSTDRLVVLAIFCLMTSINGFSWLMFDPAKNRLNAEFSPHFTSTQLTLLSSWQPIMYMLTAPVITTMLVKEDGLRQVMRLGTTLELAGATLKFCACIWPHELSSLALLHVGQILSACVSPIAIGAPAQLSARWFPPAERARATGAGVLFNNVGNALAYVVIPALADTLSYTYVVMVELYLAIMCLLVTYLFVPTQPRRAALVLDEPPPVDVRAELGDFFRNRSAVILCGVYAWSSGGYVAWTSLFDNLLSGLWSDEFIGSLTFAATVAYILGGAVSSVCVDAFLRRHMRAILITSCAGSAVCCVLLSLSVPSIFAKDREAVLDFGAAWLYLVFVMCGFWNGAATPVFYEYAVELTAPVSEGVSGTTLSYFENVGALVLYMGVGNLVTGKAMNVTFAVGMIATVVALQFVSSRPNYSELSVEPVTADSPVRPSRRIASSNTMSDRDDEEMMSIARMQRHAVGASHGNSLPSGDVDSTAVTPRAAAPRAAGAAAIPIVDDDEDPDIR